MLILVDRIKCSGYQVLDVPWLQISLGDAYRTALQSYGAGMLAEAETVCRRILQQQPNHAEALHLLGILARLSGRSDASVELIRRALSLKPDWAEANINLAAALQDLGRIDEAIACCRLAISREPDNAQAHNNLAAALQKMGLLDEAIVEYRRAIALNESVPAMHCNLGTVLEERGDVAGAMAAYRQAIVLKADYAEAHNNHAMLKILQGELIDGWREYEWRLQCRDYPRPRWELSVPRWDGSELNGRTIFLHAEQGFGDAIHFVRYVSLVVARGGKVVLGCARELRRIFERVPGVERVVVWGETLQSVDVHCPLMSLPKVFGSDLTSIPNTVPYLGIDAEIDSRWKALAGDEQGKLRVGIAWAGGPRPAGRSILPETLFPLLQVENVSWYSLQKGGDANRQAGLPLIDLTEFISDFADTAALISQMDLVISIDTAVAHLAGAIGKRVWTLLKFMPDCRWMLKREDSPWYPTMRVFRQPVIGDWHSVIERVVRELNKEPRTK